MLNIIQNIKNIINKLKASIESDTEYTTLTPVDDMSNGSEYLNALGWALKKNKVKNIALAGPYGSGKSSIIETFLNRNRSIKEKSLRISMATFVEETTDEEGSCSKNKVTFNSDEIEKGILKQLFYKVDHKKIPQSRYRKLYKINIWYVWLFFILIFLATSLVGYVFSPATINSICNKIIIAGKSVDLPNWLSYTLALDFVLICLAVFSYIYLYISSQYKVTEIKLPKDISVQKTPESNDSVFNKNMDEIIYFFETTKYRILFFEDFDRLENSEIFIHLRELNTILNNCESIKEPVIFLYAVKDDIFIDTDRTKFFDFIIPVIPVINSTNSGEILLKKLEDSKELNRAHKISQEFVLDIAPYISDMRILQNIYNEFVVYKSTLNTEQSLDLLDEPMFALMTFKNLHPRDFADIQMESGIIKKAFKDKELFVNKKKNEIQKRIDKTTEILEKIKFEIIQKRKELKCVFLGEIADWKGICRKFTPQNVASVDMSKFFDDNYDVTQWTNSTSSTYDYTLWNGNISNGNICNEFGDIYASFLERFERVSIIESEKIEQEKLLIEDLKKQIYEISSYSLAKLIEKYGIENILSDEVKNNKLLLFLLRRGYIDEKYVNYINYFKGNTITKEDMNFILSVKNLEPKPFNHKLTKTHTVIQRLQPYEFEQISIYNFDLLECMLSTNQYDEKLYLFVAQLALGNEHSWSFIDEFINLTKHKSRFINLLSNKWTSMWRHIANNAVLTYERQIYYLSMLISHAAIEDIVAMNSNGEVSDFFIQHEDILYQLSSVENAKIIAIISALKITFTDIQINNVHKDLLNYIFDNNYYKINQAMIQSVVEYKNKDLLPELDKKNYSTLIKLGYLPILEYIRANISSYTDKIVLTEANTEEDTDAIIDLLERNSDDTNRYAQIISNENFYIDDITICCSDLLEEKSDYVHSVWDMLIANKKVRPSWLNIYKYWWNFNFTDELISYITDNVGSLKEDDSSCIEDTSFISEFINTNVNCDTLGELLPNLSWEDFDMELSSIEKSKVSIMVDLRYFRFTLERYEEIKENFPDLITEFVLQNQSEYMLIRNNTSMTSEFLEDLIYSKRMGQDYIQLLLEENCSECMTNSIAKTLQELNISLTLDIFNAAWKCLNSSDKLDLMMQNLQLLDADAFESCFSELDGQYSAFSDRTSRHDVNLEYTTANLKLAQRLKDVKYITSFDQKEKSTFDTVEDTEKKIVTILCRVKAVS